FFSMCPRPPSSTPFPYTTLFRSVTEHLDGATERTEYAPLRRSVWDGNDSDPGSQHFDTPTTYEYDGLERLRAVIERESIAEYRTDRKSTRLNSSHVKISYAVFCL